MKKILWMVLIVLSTMTLFACEGEETMTTTASTAPITNPDGPRPNPVVTIDVAGYDPMVIELYYDVAPNTVNNFVNLVQSGYFDGVVFHRVIQNFMIQGGQGANLTCKIAGEFTSNGHVNDLSHVKGVISMARTNLPNSATGQFFIVHRASPHLNGSYAAFGMMTSGFDTLDAIAAVPTNSSDRPLTNVVMTKVTVDTFGYTYDAPVCS